MRLFLYSSNKVRFDGPVDAGDAVRNSDSSIWSTTQFRVTSQIQSSSGIFQFGKSSKANDMNRCMGAHKPPR